MRKRKGDRVNRLFSNEVYTPEHLELKFALHRKLLDRINLEALSAMAGERARAEIRAAVARLVEEEKIVGRNAHAELVRLPRMKEKSGERGRNRTVNLVIKSRANRLAHVFSAVLRIT